MKHALILGILGAAAFGVALGAQGAAKPATPAAAAGSTAKDITIKATSANVTESGTPVTIRIFRWSNEEERMPLIAALTAPSPGAGRPGGGRPGGAGGGNADAGGAQAAGRGGGRAAGGNGAPANGDGQGAAQGGGAGGGRAAGRGGGGRGGRGAPAAPLTPIEAFTAALQKAPTVGYIWTTDVTGYSIKYAVETKQPDGSEKIVLATDRRLGVYSPAWALKAGGTPTDYEFTVLELHLDPKGGEGKASLTTKIVADNATKQLTLDNYGSAPTILQGVKRSAN